MASYPSPHGQSLVLSPRYKVPLPDNLADFVKDRKAALALGKAFFSDMQVGSDGVQSCATCHFQAGGDVRARNQVATQGNRRLEQRQDEIKGYFFSDVEMSFLGRTPMRGYSNFDEVTGKGPFQESHSADHSG